MLRLRLTAARILCLQPALAGARWPAWCSSIGKAFGFHISVAVALASLACAPDLVIGDWSCDDSGRPTQPAEQSPIEELSLPWWTGFEDGFCGYAEGGFCYANPDASYHLVDSPVRSGKYAAAFNVPGDPAQDGLQARCARSGILPEAAYYGAWFFITEELASIDLWNLFHFDGNGAEVHHDLWDVSLSRDPDGTLRAYVFDFLRMVARPAEAGGEIPVGEWFHLEVYWERAIAATGVFELYVAGTRALSLTDLVTDDSDRGEWYVGNFATALTPRPNTLYVDDVTISETRQGGN
jgi:hypothetical protein